jgi:hypothetical protein
VYPWIVEPGKNKLNILWESVSGAEGYHIYVGETSTKPATATKTGISETTVEITDIKGNSATGVLPDSTTYYVWVEAYNGSGGSLSPSAQRMTTATVQPYWYEGVAKHDCLYGDRYYVTQTTIQYQFGEENPLNYNYIGDIVYHSEWKEEDGATWPRKDNTGKHNEKYTNKPQGVFVIKYQSPVLPIALDPKQNKLYSAVYYWGMDVDAYAGSGHTDKRQAYMVNQWNNYAERTSLEAAIDYFTCANANTFIKMGPEPYIRFMSE